MYGTSSTPKDLNLPYPSTSPFGGHRNAESDSKANLFGSHHQEQQQMNSSRLHCRPAPSSLLGELCEDFLPLRTSCPDTETCFAGFLGPDLQIGDKSSGGGGGAATSQRSHHFLLPQPRGGEEVSALRSGALPSASQMMFHSPQKKQQMPNHSSTECSYPMVGSMAMETEQIKKEGAASSSNLVRHSSSPAGLFSHLNVENGYPMLGGMAYLRNENGSMGDAEIRLKNQISFSSRQNSIMSQISEVNCGSSPEESSGGGRCYIPGFPATSWENSCLFSDNNFSGLKPGRERSELQNGDVRNHASGLTHQFSLPKTSSEMTTVEKYLQFQDAVPCKFRANRGCATHPRSIAERVRRTRISERTRKLQELVPNMDKQTNTADMLDSAVSYIKDLEEQVKTLSEKRASCTCSSGKQKQHMDPSP